MTTEEIKNLNIYERLSAISNEVISVDKNLNVGVGQASYKAVGEADVLKAVRPAEAKYRVFSYPVNRTIIESGTLDSTNYKGETKKNLFERIEVTYRFVNMDKPDEYIEIVSYGDGIDTGDKSVGKAMTYADKYALLKAYKIMTGDDPDQDPSDELNGKNTTKPTYEKRTPSAAPKTANEAATEVQKPAGTERMWATLPQKQLIDKLLRQKGKTLAEYKVNNINGLSMDQASRLINVLKALPDVEPAVEKVGGIPLDDLPL